MTDLTPDPSEADATDLTPDPVESGEPYEIDEDAVEPGKTTNDLSKQDDVEIADNQSTESDAGYYEDYDPGDTLGGAK